MKKGQFQFWHTLAVEYLTLQPNVISVEVSLLMTKTGRNPLTSFDGVPDSFSTQAEGKIPISRQVCEALFTLYCTLLFE